MAAPMHGKGSELPRPANSTETAAPLDAGLREGGRETVQARPRRACPGELERTSSASMKAADATPHDLPAEAQNPQTPPNPAEGGETRTPGG